MHDFETIAQDDDDVSVTAGFNDNVYLSAGDVHNFAAIVYGDDDVSMTAGDNQNFAAIAEDLPSKDAGLLECRSGAVPD